jgi:Ser/Thr protein kinase RdoA (MazF antagonist)
MDHSLSPSEGALEQVRRLAGPSAVITSVTRLEGGQHAGTWRVDTEGPELSIVVRQFPAGDPAAAHEQQVLSTLDGLDGLAPVLLGGDLDGRWSDFPTSLISWLAGHADITPADADGWAEQLGHALAAVHAFPSDRLSALTRGSDGNTAEEVLIHRDYWSGNVVWHGGALTGIVDWSSAARGARGYDVSWCRLDLVLLSDERVADVFLAAYEQRSGHAIADIAQWDARSLAHSDDIVETWNPNYAPLGRPDLTAQELRRRHTAWAKHLAERT